MGLMNCWKCDTSNSLIGEGGGGRRGGILGLKTGLFRENALYSFPSSFDLLITEPLEAGPYEVLDTGAPSTLGRFKGLPNAVASTVGDRPE